MGGNEEQAAASCADVTCVQIHPSTQSLHSKVRLPHNYLYLPLPLYTFIRPTVGTFQKSYYDLEMALLLERSMYCFGARAEVKSVLFYCNIINQEFASGGLPVFMAYDTFCLFRPADKPLIRLKLKNL